jgi:hypothetical protein
MTARTVLDRTAKESQDRTGRAGLSAHNIREKTVGIGKIGQDSQNMTEDKMPGTGQPEQVSRMRKTGKGQQVQEIENRTART